MILEKVESTSGYSQLGLDLFRPYGSSLPPIPFILSDLVEVVKRKETVPADADFILSTLKDGFCPVVQTRDLKPVRIVSAYPSDSSPRPIVAITEKTGLTPSTWKADGTWSDEASDLDLFMTGYIFMDKEDAESASEQPSPAENEHPITPADRIEKMFAAFERALTDRGVRFMTMRGEPIAEIMKASFEEAVGKN